MQSLILVIHVLIALALISLVLIQHGKGADVGASFGSGAANTMFGSVGPASFLMKLTSILGVVFFVTSISLGLLAVHQQYGRNAMDFMPISAQIPKNASNDITKSQESDFHR